MVFFNELVESKLRTMVRQLKCQTGYWDNGGVSPNEVD